MSNQREAWDQVGDRFSGLVRRFKERYAEKGEGPSPEEATEKLQGALRSVIDAIDGAATTLNEMARDPETRDDAKGTMLALRDALNVSFTELGEEVRGMVGARKAGDNPPEPEPPAEPDYLDED